MHLIKANVSDKVNFNEPSFASPGNSLANPVDSPIGKINASICYDLRFPYLFYQSAYKGAEVLLNPSCFPVVTGIDHCNYQMFENLLGEVLLRARAIENTCYVAASNQLGKQPSYNAYGHSLIIDPWGKILLDMKDQQGIGFANIDYLRQVRSRLPILKHQKHYLTHDKNSS